MKLLNFEVTNELHSAYYSPIIKVQYSNGPVYCTRSVVQDRTTGQWIFLEGKQPCPNALSKLLDSRYKEIVEIRRSSRPPPML